MNILHDILEHKRLEVAERKRLLPPYMLRRMPFTQREPGSLRAALNTGATAVIAEIKKASPSKRVIRSDFHPAEIAREYIAGGAAALSILTDRKYFEGDISIIQDVRSLASIPILRKDFIIDSYQLEEARAFGADAVLLIAAALDPQRLRDLHDEAHALQLECLVEVHNEQELESLDTSTIKLIGINNRNLSDFTVDITTTIRVAKSVPHGITIVSESGIASRADIDRLAAHGIHAVLVGESLMRAERPGDALRHLLARNGEDTP
jgi:indole-3-glycerol phosphate synthase